MAFTVVHKLDKDPKDIVPDYTIDTVGEPCPYPAGIKGRRNSGITQRLCTIHQQHSGGHQKPWLYFIKRGTRWHKITLFDSALSIKKSSRYMNKADNRNSTYKRIIYPFVACNLLHER